MGEYGDVFFGFGVEFSYIYDGCGVGICGVDCVVVGDDYEVVFGDVSGCGEGYCLVWFEFG